MDFGYDILNVDDKERVPSLSCSSKVVIHLKTTDAKDIIWELMY